MTKAIRVIQSAKEKGRFWQSSVSQLNRSDCKTNVDIEINTDRTFQTWLGFGGAITEAAAYNLSKLSAEQRTKILQAYYHPDQGLGYTYGRVHINSCDFALGNYDYIEKEDQHLTSFSIDHEERYLLPVLREINTITGKPLHLLASPWSPPGWMKTNGEMNNGGRLKKEYYALWADYFVHYIKAMQAKGMIIWAVSVQNEPAAKQVWDSCLYSGEEECAFVKYLGPALEKAELNHVRIVIWDHNRDLLVERAKAVLDDPQAAQYVWGIGNHWYVSEQFENLSKVHELFPDYHLIFTEGCIEGGVQLGAWHTGERYARHIIGDMNNWLEAFIDWNIVLDVQGGPNHVGNYCDAPIIVDPTCDKVYFNSSYYAIGHFSQYIKPGAKRIQLNRNGDELQATAFKNDDGSVASVILNETDASKEIKLAIDNELASITIPAHSITTVVTG